MADSKFSLLIAGATVSNTGAPARSFGWSESLFTPGTSLQITGPFVTQWAQSRAALLSRGISVVAVRKQIVNPTGGSTVATLTMPGTNGPVTGAVLDYPTLALYFRMPSATPTGKARSFILRGLPDDAVQGGEWVPGSLGAGLPRQETLFRNFVNMLVTNAWYGRYTDTSLTRVPVFLVTSAGNVTSMTPHGLSVNDLVTPFRLVRNDGRPLSGRFRVSVVTDSTNFTVSPWVTGESVAAGTNGEFRRPGFVLGPFADPGSSLVPRIVSRKVGRPFGLFRGRASRRS